MTLPSTIRSLVETKEQKIVVKNKIQAWAAKNGLTLIFISLLFFILEITVIVTRHA